MNADILREYLVKLGFGIDNPSFDKFKKVLDDTTAKVVDHTEGMTNGYLKAAGIIGTALATIGTATIGLLDKIAQNDLEYRKFALHMFMGEDAAKRMKIAVDALGQSLEDIAWMPELRGRYFELQRQQRLMQTPGDAEKQLRYLRDIRFEFTRLQVEANYGLQWIGYHLFRNLIGPLKEGREGFRALNDWIVQHMPEWSQKIADVLTVVINLGRSAWRMVENLFNSFKTLWQMLPTWGKEIAVALAIAFAPVSPYLKILSALILLMDDFYAYIDGRKSATRLAPIWNLLVGVVDKIVKGLVTAGVLIADIYENNTLKGNKKKSWDKIWEDVKGAWSESGVSGMVNPNEANKQAVQNSWIPETGHWADNENNIMPNLMQFSSPFMSSLRLPQSSNVNYDVGGITVNVPQSNASPKDVYEATHKAVKDALGNAHARNTRGVSGVYQ